MKFLQNIFKGNAEKKNIYLILLPAILGICLSMTCLLGSTFAWFTATQTAPTQAIQAAKYSVDVTVASGEEQLTASEGVYTLEAGKTYTVTLTAGGDASTGYCVISLTYGSEEPVLYHTANFPTKDNPSDNDISFTFTPDKDTKMELTSRWGTSSKPTAEKWADGGVYPAP